MVGIVKTNGKKGMKQEGKWVDQTYKAKLK